MLHIARNDNLQNSNLSEPAPKPAANKHKASLSVLRQNIARIESEGRTPQPPLAENLSLTTPQTLVSTVQKHQLQPDTIHEIWAQRPIDVAAAMALLLTSVKHDARPFLWITNRALLREHGLPYGPALKASGIDPTRLLLVRCKNLQETLWALEEGLKSKALAAVIGELGQISLTASRRLVLTARAHNTQGLLLLRSEKTISSAAYSRWQVSPEASSGVAFDHRAPGDSVLNAHLVKHRGGQRPYQQKLKWAHNAPDHLPVVTPVANQHLVNQPATHNGPSRIAG